MHSPGCGTSSSKDVDEAAGWLNLADRFHPEAGVKLIPNLVRGAGEFRVGFTAGTEYRVERDILGPDDPLQGHRAIYDKVN